MATNSAFAGGRYAVERLLGRGGMAAVYLARDRELDRPVAVKVLGEPFTLDESFVRRFRREARTAAGLSHPNIVQVYDAGDEEERLFIVMEYVDGEGLDRLLARAGKLAPAHVLELAAQVSSALHYAHGKGVVHRDVKPGNLLLRTDGVLKVADFGIARPAHDARLTETGTVLGTAAYLAPEQVRGEPATPRSDIYSLGVVLYELFTGEPPYRVENLAQLAANRDQPVRPVRDLEPSVPPAAEAAVMRCLARNPRYRPASAAELAAALGLHVRRAAVTVPVEEATLPFDRRTLPLPARRMRALGGRPLALMTAVVVISAAVGFAFAAAGGRDTEGSRAPRVEPVPQSANPAKQAENLATWIRDHSRGR
jgi:eukaryotic-like serine/threonine-protein kinase